jgi:hypothetical protein
MSTKKVLNDYLSTLYPRPRRALRPTDVPEVTAGVDQLVDAMTHPDESQRRDAVERLLLVCLLSVVALLCQRLVRRLTARSETVRRRVRATLVQLGRRALPAVTNKLLHTRSERVQDTLIDALSRIARGLPPDDRADLMIQLWIGLRSTDEKLRRGLARAIATLRVLNEQTTRAGESPAASKRDSGRPLSPPRDGVVAPEGHLDQQGDEAVLAYAAVILKLFPARRHYPRHGRQ